jgi:hypothetical protein
MDMTAISGYGQNPFGIKKTHQPPNTGHAQALKASEQTQKPTELIKNKEMAASALNPMSGPQLNFRG